MSTVGNVWKFIVTCWKLNLAGAMEFRLSFMLTAGMMVVNDIVWIVFWGLFFRRFPVINGWELTDVMMMWAVAAGGVGLMNVFFGNANRLSTLVATGQLDTYLAQPKPVLLHVLISRMSVASIGDVIFSVMIYSLFGDHSMIGLGKYLMALIISVAICLCYTVSVHSLAFFIGNAEGIGLQFYNALVAFTTYPTDIFKGWGRLMLFSVIPAGFISYMPIGMFRGFDPMFIFGAMAAATALLVIAISLFYIGLKRYSSGNMMTLRM